MCNVNIATGEVTQFITDFFLPGIIPLHFVRSYSSTSTEQGPLGYAWTHNLDVSVRLSNSHAVLTYNNGKAVTLPVPPVDAAPPVPTAGLMVTQTPGALIVTEPDRNKLIFARPARSDQ